jgi:hypothetical protein
MCGCGRRKKGGVFSVLSSYRVLKDFIIRRRLEFLRGMGVW